VTPDDADRLRARLSALRDDALAMLAATPDDRALDLGLLAIVGGAHAALAALGGVSGGPKGAEPPERAEVANPLRSGSTA